jgi:hypothetical protein
MGSVVVKVLVGAAIFVGGFVLVVGTVTARPPEVPLVELAVVTVIRYLGAALAVVAGGVLLAKAVSGARPGELLGLTVPLTAGLLIGDFHWALAVYLWVLGIGYFGERIFVRPRSFPEGKKETVTAAPSVPGPP